MWIASPSDISSNRLIRTSSSGISNAEYSNYYSENVGFRPIVCLNSGTKLQKNLVDQNDGEEATYSIISPIEATIEYDELEEKINIEVTHHENDIVAIMNSAGNNILNADGITASEDVTEKGTYRFTIIDKEGNIIKLKITTIPSYYGKKVTNYTCSEGDILKGTEDEITWRIFHKDKDNIYLIADNYIPYTSVPKGKGGTEIDAYDMYGTCCNSIVNSSEYSEGAIWINENSTAKDLLKTYLEAYPNKTTLNMQAVAYMMDTDVWSNKFAGDKAEYAIGGPTIELFCASYKAVHQENYIEYEVSENGYCLYWNTSKNHTTGSVSDVDTNVIYNNIYINTNTTNAKGYWIASPSKNSSSSVIISQSSEKLDNVYYGREYYGFRPIVCIASGSKLQKNTEEEYDGDDATYSIISPIEAKAMHNVDKDTITIEVTAHKNPIVAILDEEGNNILSPISLTAEVPVNENKITNKFIIVDSKGNKIKVTAKLRLYATLYTDGTLTFSADNRKIAGKTEKESWDMTDREYKYYWDIPWDGERDNVTNVEFLNKVYPTTTIGWFRDFVNLTNVDLSKLITNNVTDMNCMFTNCSNLTSLDLTNFNTSKVTSMTAMFYGCKKLTSLDLRSFDTANVKTIAQMFCNCTSLKDINLSSFNTSNVTTVREMFESCSSLEELDLSSFDVRNVTTMQFMFYCSTKLTTIYVSSSTEMWPDTIRNSGNSSSPYCNMFASCGTNTVTRKIE